MHDTIVHWRNDANCYSLRAPPGAVIFAQDNDCGPTSGKMNANDVNMDPMDLRKVKCLKYQEFVHFDNKCPNGSKIVETHANVGTEETSNNDMDGLMSTFKIYVDADYLFGDFSMVTSGSTKRYLESALTTLTQSDKSVTSGKSAKALHQNNCSIPTSYILLDNQSTVDVFCNLTLLRNIHASDWTLHLRCNAGTAPSNQVGYLPVYGHVWYHPKGITNILGLSNISGNKKYWVRYDSQEIKDFIVNHIKYSKDTCFRRATYGLH